MPARPLGSGMISFGLVAIPVKLYGTGESAASVRFNMVHAECGTRVKYRFYCPTDDRLVEREDLSKGYEFAKGQFVLFSDEELKVLQPEATNAIEISEFVPLEDVDPIFFEKSYYLGPGQGGDKPYKLLSQVMRETSRAALARYAARGKNYLVLLRPFESGLIMQQLRYSDDIRAFDEVPIGDAEISEAELDLARQLVEQSSKKAFDPTPYRDEVREQIIELIERKVQGEEIVAAPEESPKAQVIDLMEALKASLGEGPFAGARPSVKGKARKRPKRATTGGKAKRPKSAAK
ncbi:MAG: Ku protein [Acidobacteria bacterium]|nr:Ku protein [Acidobacteriota bacterium]